MIGKILFNLGINIKMLVETKIFPIDLERLFHTGKNCFNMKWLAIINVGDVGKWKHIGIHYGSVMK